MPPAQWLPGGHRTGDQDGSAAVMMLVFVPVVVLVMVVALEIAAMVAAGAAASGVADLAALAAVGAHADRAAIGGGPARTAAEVVAHANGATLVTCDCNQVPVEVVVAVTMASPFGFTSDRVATGRGRATLVSELGTG